eukprot:snap_masked-scaffold_6-processed-gene-14.6-mRNA-1 protein AED:0.13 eAED:0.14 QI:0/-1/0/1/-1/1/1/0/390
MFKTFLRKLSTKPAIKPNDARFGSGPCKKRPGYDGAKVVEAAAMGRSHRSKLGKGKLKEAIDKSKELLKVPEGYLLGIVPASDTGAFEMAMWSLLGPRPIDAFHWESFGKGWVGDLTNELKLKEQANIYEAGYGDLPELSKARDDSDVIFTFNGTTSGVRVPDDGLAWLKSSNERTGLTFCDATSAAFAMNMNWEKLDITTFSWQKVLGGEGAHGVIVLSPKAVQFLEDPIHQGLRPLPKIFRMTKGGKLIKGIFEGSTINTPSMLCVEDYLDALYWAEGVGGLDGLINVSEKNLGIMKKFVEDNDWIEFLATKEEITSNTSICLQITDLDKDQLKKMTTLLEEEDVAYDIGSYRDAPPGLRIWGGATVENEDMEKLMPWLSWAHEEAKN